MHWSRARSYLAVSAIAVLAATYAGSGTAGAENSSPAVPPGGNVAPAAEPVPAQYIVTLRTPPSVAPAAANALTREHGGAVVRTYDSALSGYTARMSDAQAQALSQDPNVASVEQDGYVHATAVEPSPPSWGLDRIDQRNLPLDKSYTSANDGAGVTAYVIDTGIRPTNADFGGRASVGFDAIGDGRNGIDCNGHGTHVAGTVGGSVFGVAKSVAIVAVRVLDCSGSGTYSQVIAGIDWVSQHHTSAAVANMSLGGGPSTALDTAVENSVAAGVTYAIAAGNSNASACNYSPARAPHAITVGATTITDARASYSNFGSCVDLFAPGSDITSDWNTSDTATNTISGTSMATPHVTGSAALYLAGHPGASPATVTAGLMAAATTGHVVGAGAGSPNLLDYVGSTTPPPPPAPTAPTAPVLKATAAKRAVTLTWTTPANGGSPITGYRIYRSTSTTTGFVAIATLGVVNASTDAAVVGGTKYYYAVTAVNVVGESLRSAIVNATPKR